MSASGFLPLADRGSALPAWLRRTDGELSRQLQRVPGAFGLGQVPADRAPDRIASMICGYCSTGCSLDVHVRDGRAVNLTPSPEHPVNLGMACPKGWEALAPLRAADRATTPLFRPDRARTLVPVTWQHALDEFVRGFKGVQDRHGAESVAFLSTGQIVTEEMALLGALAKFGMGLRHGDGNTRQCMATSVVAYKQAFGFDAPPYTYADFEESDVIVLVGSNLAVAHPIMWERVARNPNDPTVVVIDPRRTETAAAASLHVPVRPKGDLDLLYGVANLLIQDDHVDLDFVADHTNGFEEFSAFVAGFDLDRVTAATGLEPEIVRELATIIARGQRVSFWWTMGVNQSHQGVRTAQAIINLALMTGNIGRPGTGANSITGQCNAMGSRLFSNTTNLLGGHDWARPQDRAKVSAVTGIPEARIPDGGGWAYDQIIEGIASGHIRGLWVIATNAAHSWINSTALDDLFDRLEFLVVQDLYATTETAQVADLVLPAAGWAEKTGTFINSERRLGLVQQVTPAPGLALSDFRIFQLVAEAWGCGELFRRWSSPQAVFEILRELSRGQPCDITGIDGYDVIDAAGGVQWPCPEGTDPGSVAKQRRLFSDGSFFHDDRRARFVFEEPTPPVEHVRRSRPFVLLTGRGSTSQWHTQTRTAKSATLTRLACEETDVEVHPHDAARLGIEPEEIVEVVSERGRMRARAFLTPNVPVGHVFVAMHDAQTNKLTFPSFDPYSRQPAYKHAAVSLRRIPGWARSSSPA